MPSYYTVHNATKPLPHLDGAMTVLWESVVLLSNTVHKTVVAERPTTLSLWSHDTIHDACTPRCFHVTTVLLKPSFYRQKPSTKLSWQRDQQPSHDSPTTLSTTQPRRLYTTTVARRYHQNRRFIVKNRPQNRRGIATSNPLMTVLRHGPWRNHDASSPQRCHDGFVKAVVLLSKPSAKPSWQGS